MIRLPLQLRIETATASPDPVARTRLIAACFSMVVIFGLLVSWLDPALPWPLSFTSLEPWSMLALNLLPVVLLHALLYIVTRRLVLAGWLSVLLLAALYAINAVKVRELATPLLPDDFLFLKAIKVNYSFFSNYLAASRQQLLWAIGILGVTALLTRERATLSMSGYKRLFAGLCVVALMFTLVQGRAPWRTIYDPGRLQFEPWAPTASAARTGIITNLLLFHWELHQDDLHAPDLTDAVATLQASLGSLQPASGAITGAVTADLPDIILVQSESLFDPGDLENVAEPQMRNLAEIARRSYAGGLRVPTFAGGTIRTEFEVLTGLPLAAFPQVRYPYLQLDLERAPSIAKLLAKQGYRTLAIHPNGGAFWNRNHAFRALGFERFDDVAVFEGAHHHGWYVSDAALTDRIIASLQDEGPPQLVLGISIQNHGPYTPQELAQSPPSCTTDSRGADMLDVYCDLARASDVQLARLVEFARNRERPTLVLFYSDHMPPLQPVYEQVKLRGGLAATEHPVPWLLFDNRSDEASTRELRAWELPLLLLDRVHVALDDHFDVMRRLWSQSISDDVANAVARLSYWNGLGGFLAQAH